MPLSDTGLCEPVLRVRDLSVRFSLVPDQTVRAVEEVAVAIGEGEAVGILGESGCGKTTLALALLRLLPPNARITRGSIQLHGRELLTLSEKQLEAIRGAQVSLILQEPALSLSPVLRIIDQVCDVLAAHHPGWGRRQRRREAEAALSVARLDEPRLVSSYPHELSSGQRQRAAIALALACRPSLLIADEPTSSLDASLQVDILALLADRKRLGLSLLFISHDPASLARISDRLLIMYAGRVVEEGPLDELLRDPLHPYTKGLLQSLPRPTEPARARLAALPGAPPDLARLPRGCAFEPRCAERLEVCALREPAETSPLPTRRVRCVHHGG